MKKLKRVMLVVLALLLLWGCWWTYCLIWGRPLNLNHYYLRAMLENVLDNPELLTRLGMIDGTLLDFHSGRLTDASPKFIDKEYARLRRTLSVLRSYPLERQTPSQRLSTEILDWFLENQRQGEPYRYHRYPVNQLFGTQSETPDLLINLHKVTTDKTARRYIKRLSCFGAKFDGLIETLHLEASKGVIPPRFVLEKVLSQMRDFRALSPEKNPLYVSFIERLDKVGEFDAKRREELAAAARTQIEKVVYPAYDRLTGFVESLRQKATDDDGVWKLPDGATYYAYLLKSYTGTDLTAEQVHQVGLAEVQRIQSEMRSILESLGHSGKTVAEQMRNLSREPRFLYPDTDDGRTRIMTDYRAIIAEVNTNLGNAFALRPKAGVEVVRVPQFKEKTSAAAYYQGPALDGSRQGMFFVNLHDIAAQPKFGMRSLAYHEAIPGHHFQIALAQELKGLPLFRKVIPFTSFVEGWALYAEQLAWELGLQNDPYSNLGRLQAELFRAVRLVVDTGIHHKRWTRQQAIDYMAAQTGSPESEVVAEIERYIVMPGQACAYKIGMLRILELRKQAVEKLGPRYDPRAFHKVLLENGAVPLSTLSKLVDAWIQQILATKDIPAD